MSKEKTEQSTPIRQAVEGDAKALQELISEIQDMVFNLSVRMLGTIPDAEDASQEILIKVITNLSSFREECSFQTWVYRIAVNYLLNYKKSMFAQHPLDFEFYGNDIRCGQGDMPETVVDEKEREVLAEELKLSCTNVMLQCLDAESRCIFIFGTMFGIDSRTAGSILGITPENFRQKLSRIRTKVAAFLAEYCGLSGTGMCSCQKRVEYAMKQRRISPERIAFVKLHPLDETTLSACKADMEKLDELSLVFEELPLYQTPDTIRDRMEMVLNSAQMKQILEY